MAKGTGTKATFKALGWAGRISMFCMGVASMVVLAVVCAVVLATMVAATAVPDSSQVGRTGRGVAPSRHGRRRL